MSTTNPHKCPVCEGRGEVVAGFYLGTTSPESCRTCLGEGLVWGLGTTAATVRIVGDLVVEGTLIAANTQRLLEPSEVQNVDIVSGSSGEPYLYDLTSCEPSYTLGSTLPADSYQIVPWGPFDPCAVNCGGDIFEQLGNDPRTETYSVNITVHGASGEEVASAVQRALSSSKALPTMPPTELDMPMLILTPRSIAEIAAAENYIARLVPGTHRDKALAVVERMQQWAADRYGPRGAPDQPEPT